MFPFLLTTPTLAVSVIFCLYNIVRQARREREHRLRERVTYLLWVMAERTA
jgi:hypothetical protein